MCYRALYLVALSSSLVACSFSPPGADSPGAQVDAGEGDPAPPGADAAPPDVDAAPPSALNGLRVETPCTAPFNPTVCFANPTSTTVTFEGTPGTVYDVTLRVRGVVEQNDYQNGQEDGLWYIGGQPDNGNWNVLSLRTSEPAQVYYFNNGETDINNCFALDFTRTLAITGGADVTLAADPADGFQIINRDPGGAPIVIPDIAPAPEAFPGQFLQIDVVSIQAR